MVGSLAGAASSQKVTEEKMRIFEYDTRIDKKTYKSTCVGIFPPYNLPLS